MKKKAGRKTLKPDKKLFETLYYNDRVKAKDLAKEWNVTENTIYSWAYQYRKESENDNRKTKRNKTL